MNQWEETTRKNKPGSEFEGLGGTPRLILPFSAPPEIF